MSIDSDWGTVLSVGGDFLKVLALIGFGALIYLQVWPAMRLLARSLPQESVHHGTAHLYWQALLTLFGLLWRGVQAGSLHKAARLRIELEVLRPMPMRPLRLDVETESDRHPKKEFRTAKKEYTHARKAWLEDTKAALRALVRSEEVDRSIEIDTFTPLIGNSGIQRYFNALHSSRLPTGQGPEFLSRLTVKSGFIAPIHLLTGVLARYEQEWKVVVEEFGRSTIREGDPFRYSATRKIQTFIFDCWLMWGPSIPLCTCPEWHGNVALQYGTGDENNSLTLRCASPEIVRVLATERDERAFAWQARVSGKLKWGSALRDTGICPAQEAIWRDERLVLDTIGDKDGVQPAGGTAEQVWATYYSAYLWIIFLMCDRDTGKPFNPDHKWRDMVPFFVHGNLADRETYDFQTSQLARTALDGALRLLGDDTSLSLWFACAIDESACGYNMVHAGRAGQTIRMKIAELVGSEAEAERLHLHIGFDKSSPFMDGDYSACALPEIVRDYYNENDDSTTELHDIRITRGDDAKLLKRFYEDCYLPEFPDPDEQESIANIKEYLHRKEKGWYKNNNYHVVIAVNSDGDPVGGSICDYLEKPNAGVIEYLLIRPDLRRGGTGGRLREHTERLLHDDANRRRGRPLDWIVGEMDDPFRTPGATSGFDPFTRARVWHRWGYRMLDFRYVQPALSRTQSPVQNLLLMAKASSDLYKVGTVPIEQVELLISEYMRWAMRLDEPEKNPEFQRMSADLHKSTSVPMIPFDHYISWDSHNELAIREVVTDQDPDLSEVERIYDLVFGGMPSALPSSCFRAALSPTGLSHRSGFRYHLWTIRTRADLPCNGIASFVSMPVAGFGGYLCFDDTLRGTGRLATMVSRIEERMVRDNTGASGWYIECDGATTRDIFAKVGFRELDVDYHQPRKVGSLNRDLPLHFMYKTFGRVYQAPVIERAVFVEAIRQIYTAVYDIPPDGNPIFDRLTSSLGSARIVPVV